jgi:hypothetical protein
MNFPKTPVSSDDRIERDTRFKSHDILQEISIKLGRVVELMQRNSDADKWPDFYHDVQCLMNLLVHSEMFEDADRQEIIDRVNKRLGPDAVR